MNSIINTLFNSWYVDHPDGKKYAEVVTKIEGTLCSCKGFDTASKLITSLINANYIEYIAAYKAAFTAGFQLASEIKENSPAYTDTNDN